MRYRIEISGDVRRYVRRLTPGDQQRVVRRIQQIADDPFNPNFSKPLHGPLDSVRSAHVGALRILFEVDGRAETIAIHDIGPRGDIYKGN